MSDPASLKYQLLAELLQALEAAGYQFGVEKHLHIRQLLSVVPEDTAIEDFKEILAPVICNSEQDQIFFYDIFPTCLERARAVHQPVAAVVEKKKRNLWPLWIAMLSAVLLAVLIPIVSEEAEDVIGKPEELQSIYASIQPDSTGRVCVREDDLSKLAPVVDSWICKDSLIRHGESDFGVFSIEDHTCLRYQARDTLGQDTICITLVDSTGHQSKILFYPTIEKAEIPTPDTIPESQIGFTERAFIFPTAESIIRERLEVEPLSSSDAFLVDNAWWLKPLLILLLGALLWSILKYRDEKRRKLIAEVETRDKAPYIWDIEIDGIEAIEMNDAFVRSVHQLRRRTLGEHFVLDIPKTVKTTIEKAGMVNFAYRQQTRPPEYLLLIDRQNAANHQALVYDLLFRAFQKNEIIVERFFYDDDPRDCYNEAFPDGISIRELQLRFYNARLIILGNAYQLLNPLNGKLARWTEIFTQWKERSILTTRPTDDWGRDERRLGDLFHVLPASIQGFEYLIEQLDAGDDADFDSWPEHVKDATKRSIQLEGSLINSLKQHYSEDMLVWIAACAVYPSLHWDLSLHLGELLSGDENKLLQIDRLLDLGRLPWFTQGEIPKQARAVLIEWMEEAHPATLSTVRHALSDILNQTAPPEDSAVWEEYSMNVALNEWLITEDEKKKQALEDRIADMLEKGVEADFTIIKYLDRERSALDFIVPDTWKKYVHKGGYSGLGMKDFWQDALYWALPIWLIASMGILWYQPATECNGELVVYQEGGENEWRVNLASDAKNVVFLDNGQEFIATMVSGHPALFNHKGEVVREFIEEEGRATVGLSINNMDVDPINQRLIANYDNGRIEVWNWNGGLENSFLLPSTQYLGMLRAIPGQNLVLNGYDNQAVLLDFDGKQVNSFRIENGPVAAMAVSQDGRFCAMAGTDNIVKAWSLDGEFRQSTEGDLDQRVSEGKGLQISALTFSPDGKTLIAGTTTGHVILFDVETGEQIGFPSRLQSGKILSLATSSSGDMIFAGNDKGYAVLSDYSGDLIRSFVYNGRPVIKVGISDDEESVKMLSDNGVVKSSNLRKVTPSEYCLDSDEDHILWSEYLAHKAILEKDHQEVEILTSKVDSIFQTARATVRTFARNTSLDTARMSFHQNIATEYFNIAVGFANEYDQYGQQSLAAPAEIRDSACLYFGRAARLLPDDEELQQVLVKFCEGGEIPTAKFTLSPQEGYVNAEIRISNQSVNAVSYSWNFGDGNRSTTPDPTHIYNRAGTYTIKLKAFNGSNVDSMSTSLLIKSTPDVVSDPDQDDDGVPDSKDDCPDTDKGIRVNSAGCPDQDGDGVRDVDDECPTMAGTIQNAGCPEVDIEARKKVLVEAVDQVARKREKDFNAIQKRAKKLNSPRVNKYTELILDDYNRLLQEVKQKLNGDERPEDISRDLNKRIDQFVEEINQYMKKAESEGGTDEIESVRQQDLTIAAGETYTVKKNQRLAIGRFVMEKGARISFAKGVTQFELAARIVNISAGTVINGSGQDGADGKPGSRGRAGAICKNGAAGGHGENGKTGGDGVDIILTLEEVEALDGLQIIVNGGNGGNGGQGGMGGRGGRSKGSIFQCDCPAKDGGRGGNGGYSGRGGNGGNVTIQYSGGGNAPQAQQPDDSMRKLRNGIKIQNEPGRPGRGGEAGKGGDGGKKELPVCPEGRNGKPGVRGSYVAQTSAKKGEINFRQITN